MSLNDQQRRQTASEFAENLTRSGLSPEEVRERAALPLERFSAALEVTPDAHPVDVWWVRDTLEQMVRESGVDPVSHAVLTEEMRGAAAVWFGVGEGP
ncbi:DUF2316 family protein [Corynebacterium sp.]|uniref:DUF2316 family protein n=1 Tax=Corynebacterium sp. TaxID=1720 RepID=UPI0028AE7285|nr:DUF2316 family protein [Corynebacterium sp.]